MNWSARPQRIAGTLIVFHLVLTACRLRIPAEPLAMAPKGETFGKNGEYHLGVKDVIKFEVIGDETFSGQYMVHDDGTVLLPVIGAIPIAGRSLSEVQSSLLQSISPYVQKPNAAVSIVSKGSFRVFFNGEIMRIGAVQLEEQVTMLRGLILAGGLTPFANNRIVLIRATKGGEPKRYAVNYSDLLDGVGTFDQFYLERDDVIVAE